VGAERSTGALKAGPRRTEAIIEAGERGSEGVIVLLTGPFGGLTDDLREFLLCLAGDGLPLTGWGDLDPAGLRLMSQRLPGGGVDDRPEGLALARRRATLLRSLCDAGRLAEARDGALRLTALGREFLDLPAAAQLGFVFAAWWEGVDWGQWAPRPSSGGCCGTSARRCSRSWPACRTGRWTWRASPAASAPWSGTAGRR
jgi:hypothetical protein